MDLCQALENALRAGDPAFNNRVKAVTSRYLQGGGCKARSDIGPMAFEDDCGNLFLRAGGKVVQVLGSQTIKRKIIKVGTELVIPRTGGDAPWSVSVKPQGGKFLPYRIIAAVSTPWNPAAATPERIVPGYGLDDVFLDTMKIGNTDQDCGKPDSGSAFSAVSLRAFEPQSQGQNDLELDLMSSDDVLLLSGFNRPVGSLAADASASLSFEIVGLLLSS